MAVAFLALGAANSCPQLDPETEANVANALWMLRYNPFLISPQTRQKLASPANSNTEFGNREKSYLTFLLNNPFTFTPDYSAYYANLALFADSITPHQVHGRNTNFLGQDQSRGFTELPHPSPNLFTFPKDHEVDLHASFGWYYVAGVVNGIDGKQYGVMYMMFFNPVLSPPVANAQGISDTENMGRVGRRDCALCYRAWCAT
jgi:hypothetical protein